MGRYDEADSNAAGTAALLGKIEQLTTAARAPQRMPDGSMVLLAPEGYTPHAFPAAPAYTAPPFIKARPVFHESTGFENYVNQFKQGGTTRIFANLQRLRLAAVLDYHDAGKPGTVSHFVDLAMATTPSWDAWTGAAGATFNQVDFAEFVEEHADDINSPAAADLLEMVENFQENRTVTFQSKVSRANGSVRLNYVDEDDAKASGAVKIPERLKLQFPVFVKQYPVDITVFVRTKVKDGKLTISYALHKIGDIRRNAFDAVCDQVSSATGILIAAGQID